MSSSGTNDHARLGADGAEPEDAIVALARSFPSVAHAPGLDPWDPGAFAAWAAGPAPSTGAQHAARFVLSVWSCGGWSEPPGRFDLVKAWKVWDDAHCAAALRWLRRPFWP